MDKSQSSSVRPGVFFVRETCGMEQHEWLGMASQLSVSPCQCNTRRPCSFELNGRPAIMDVDGHAHAWVCHPGARTSASERLRFDLVNSDSPLFKCVLARLPWIGVDSTCTHANEGKMDTTDWYLNVR